MITASRPQRFNTANGPYYAKMQLPIDLAGRGDGWLNATANPYIMASTPSVISVGKRVMHEGYSFIWLNGKQPCFVSPTGMVLPFDIEEDCPYLRDGGNYSTIRDPSLAENATGVAVRNGEICIVESGVNVAPAPKESEAEEKKDVPVEEHPPPSVVVEREDKRPILKRRRGCTETSPLVWRD